MLIVDWSQSISTPIGAPCASTLVGTSKNNIRTEMNNALFMFPPLFAKMNKVMKSWLNRTVNSLRQVNVCVVQDFLI